MNTPWSLFVRFIRSLFTPRNQQEHYVRIKSLDITREGIYIKQHDKKVEDTRKIVINNNSVHYLGEAGGFRVFVRFVPYSSPYFVFQQAEFFAVNPLVAEDTLITLQMVFEVDGKFEYTINRTVSTCHPLALTLG